MDTTKTDEQINEHGDDAENTTAVYKFTRMRYTEADADIVAWMRSQSSRSGSLRVLVSAFVAEYGAVDVTSVLPQMFSRLYGDVDVIDGDNVDDVVSDVANTESDDDNTDNTDTVQPATESNTTNAKNTDQHDNTAVQLAQDMFD